MNDWEARSTRTQKRRRSSLGNRETPVKSQKTSSSSLKALIVDNGAYTIKIGHVNDAEPKVIPNCIMKAKSERKRLFVGQQIDECRDCSGLYYLLPCEKGYITRWEVQKPIWDHVFSKNVCPFEDHPVILTQPLFNFKSIQDCIDEIFFEEYEVSSLFRCSPPDMAYLNYAKHNKLTKSMACLVVDTGFSFTHIVPYVFGNKYLRGIKRINVGGKLLTNHLKDIISYRQYNVMEETYVINQVKEDTCYVSKNIHNDLVEAAKPFKQNSIVKNYILPDFNVIRRGFIQEIDKIEPNEDNYQVLRLNNERFIVPEILFHPSDIGIKSMGIAEAVVDSIFSCPPDRRKALAKNIILVGGNCKFPGFKDRIYADLRSLLPVEWTVKLFLPEDPITYPWKGGGALLKTHDFRSNLVTKQDYEELGSGIIQEKFNNFMLDSSKLEVNVTSNKIKSIEYLPVLTADVLGKQELLPNNEDDDKMEVEEDNEEKDESSMSMVAEDIDSEKGVTKKGRRNKVVEEEEVETENIDEDSFEDDILENKDIFPFDVTSYL